MLCCRDQSPCQIPLLAPEYSQSDGWKPPGAEPAHSSFFPGEIHPFPASPGSRRHLPRDTCLGTFGTNLAGVVDPSPAHLSAPHFIYQFIYQFVPLITELRITSPQHRCRGAGKPLPVPFWGLLPHSKSARAPPCSQIFLLGWGSPKTRASAVWGCDTSQNSSGGWDLLPEENPRARTERRKPPLGNIKSPLPVYSQLVKAGTKSQFRKERKI